jgi:uncharacterized membrane protein YesL
MPDTTPLNEHTYVRLTVVRLWENLLLVLLAAAVFSVLCAPAFLLSVSGAFVPALAVGAVTLAPAWAALLALEADIVRNVGTHIGVMFRALPRYWVRSVGLGLLAAFPLFGAALVLPGLAQPEVPTVVWLGLAADALGVLILASLYLYAFPLLVLHDVSLVTALRNALILASRHIVNTVGLLGMGVLFAMATLYLSSGLLVFLPAIWGMFIVNNCRLVVSQELSKTDQPIDASGE